MLYQTTFLFFILSPTFSTVSLQSIAIFSVLSINCSNDFFIFSKVPWWSKWSASIFVTIEYLGLMYKNELSLSSASAIKYSELPIWLLLLISGIIPPTTINGSFSKSATLIIELVVVFPWVPATAIPSNLFIISASSSPLFIFFILLSTMYLYSGFVSLIAVEYTNKSIPLSFTFSSTCPI